MTTLVSGQCGDSPFPFSDEMFEEIREENKAEYGVDVDWKNVQGFLSRLERGGMALNYSTFVGHGTVRAAAMGYGGRKPTAVRDRAYEEDGGRQPWITAPWVSPPDWNTRPGASHRPRRSSSSARVAAASGGLYATHMRNEQDFVLEAVDEAIRIGREAGLALQISHLKVGYAGKLAEAPGRAPEDRGGQGIGIWTFSATAIPTSPAPPD